MNATATPSPIQMTKCPDFVERRKGLRRSFAIKGKDFPEFPDIENPLDSVSMNLFGKDKTTEPYMFGEYSFCSNKKPFQDV
jgi:hypothetical protein